MNAPVCGEFLTDKGQGLQSSTIPFEAKGYLCVWGWREDTSAPYSAAITVPTPGAPRPGAEVRGESDAVFGAMRGDEGRGNILLSPDTHVVLSDGL